MLGEGRTGIIPIPIPIPRLETPPQTGAADSISFPSQQLRVDGPSLQARFCTAASWGSLGTSEKDLKRVGGRLASGMPKPGRLGARMEHHCPVLDGDDFGLQQG